MEIAHMIIDKINYDNIVNINFLLNELQYNIYLFVEKNYIIIEFNDIKFKCISNEIYEKIIKKLLIYIYNINDDQLYESMRIENNFDKAYNNVLQIIVTNKKSINHIKFEYLINYFDDPDIINTIYDDLSIFYYINY